MCPKAMLRKCKASGFISDIASGSPAPSGQAARGSVHWVYRNFTQNEIKPKELWIELGGEIKFHQLVKAGEPLNMHISDLGVDGRDSSQVWRR